ncbi:MAG: hypothetical protein AUG08_06035 [Acidobacteria bacterium 13_1_20CM_2_55_15]|nr:MAG: hypothetical protein AUH28_06845 [Acidobacteria bacterium 13_1_40CM_56_16]OLE88972.1 MAG: hypothetical protein AUG08_06035 [Acidobacteria bacterium 13_1_20CM_2_55_15]PYS14989.1 MAG: hypothetical protein DMG17_15920 [Acidobacteriota bacterium]
MKPNQSPRIANWLLRHFGCSPNNATVIGDLDERYRSGRSSAWYWRQATIAIVVSLFNEIWNHKLLTITALLVGWAVFVVSRYGFYLTQDLLFALASWSRFWRHKGITLAVQISVVTLSRACCGWLVARLCRKRQKAMVLAYAAFIAGVQIVLVVSALLRGMSLQTFIYNICFITITPVSILVGGGVFRSRTDCDGPGDTHAMVC